MVDVTGRIKTGNRAFVKGKSGKNTFVIGTTQGTTSPLEEQAVSDATIEVDSVDIVGNICNALKLKHYVSLCVLCASVAFSK